jgi:hypothetical protein
VCARSSNSACCKWRATSTRPLSRSWLRAFRSFTTPRSFFDCLVDRFCKPLRRFNALVPLDALLSGSQRNAIVSHTRAQVCYVLDSWLLRHYASDFLADSELFADCCAFLAQGGAPTRARAAPCRATTVATPPRRWRAAAAATTAATCCAQAARGRRAARARLPAQGQPVRDDAGGDRHGQANGARVALDALTSELLWALLQCGDNDNCQPWDEHELPSGRFALRHRRRHCVVDLPARGRARRRARVRGGSAPTFADSLAVWYRVSPGETALPFHRKRLAYEASTKKMLKYCGDELDPKSRTLLDYHPVEVARQMALAARADFVLVRSSELISRAWMKDAADTHARDCPNIERIINQFNRISRWVASEIVRVTDDAQMRLSMLKRFIELAHCCRDVQNLHRMYAVYVGLNQWAVPRCYNQALKAK